MEDKVFLFGDFYSESKISKLDKMKMYDTKTQYEINMNEYIDEVYDNEDSMKILWDRYKAHILEEEKIKGKDVSQFTREEMIGLFSSIYTTSSNVKASVYSFLSNYIAWRISAKGDKINNVFNSINQDELCIINGNALKKKLVAIEELDYICEEFEKYYTDNINMYISLVLARYGIMGKDLCEMVNLKFKDVHEDNMIVDIISEDGVVKEYPIDEIFIKWVNKAKEELMKEEGSKEVIENSYVIAKSKEALARNTRDNKANPETVYTHHNKIFKETKTRKISFNLLKKSRMIELLIKNYRSKSVINTSDILEVVRMFNPESSAGSWNTLKNDYEAVTGDKVFKLSTRRALKIDVVDNNPIETAEKMYIDIFEGWDMPVVHEPKKKKPTGRPKKESEEDIEELLKI